MKNLVRVVEALLFSSNMPLSLVDLVKATGDKENEILNAISKLSGELESGGHALVVKQVAGGWQLFTRTEFSPWVLRLCRIRPAVHLSQAALETLAIIAYRQPITKAEVEGIRGVECSGVLHTLLERHLIGIGTRKETAGRPFTYITTGDFLVHFGLNSLADLPRMEEVDLLVGKEEGLFAESNNDTGYDESKEGNSQK